MTIVTFVFLFAEQKFKVYFCRTSLLAWNIFLSTKIWNLPAFCFMKCTYNFFTQARFAQTHNLQDLRYGESSGGGFPSHYINPTYKLQPMLGWDSFTIFNHGPSLDPRTNASSCIHLGSWLLVGGDGHFFQGG